MFILLPDIPVKPNVMARPCPVLNHSGHLHAAFGKTGLFLEARVPWEIVY